MCARSFFLLAGLLLWQAVNSLPGWAQQPTYRWAVSGGGLQQDTGECVATDQLGNVYQAGHFSGTARFGSFTLTTPTTMLDVFLAKYTPQGQLLWVRQISGDNIKSVASLAVDATGEAVLTGDYTSVQLPPTSTPTLTLEQVTLTGGSIYDEMYVARYDAQGRLLWANHTVGQGLAGTYCAGTDVALAADGSTYVAGYYGGNGSVRFNQLTVNAAPRFTQFLAKYDRAGQLLWVRDKLGAGRGLLVANTPQVAISPTQQVYLLGLFSQAVTLGSFTLTTANTAATNFCAILDAQGNFLAARQDVLTPQEACLDLTISPAGNLLCACDYQGTTQHGTRQFTSATGVTPLLLSFSAQGDFQWGQPLGPAGPQGNRLLNSVAVDGQGNVYTSFFRQGSVLVSYSATGTLRWSFASLTAITSLAVSTPDEVVGTGLYEATASFGPITLTSQGQEDAFLVKLLVTGAAASLPEPGGLPLLFVPNIITPNQDGRNDYFQVRGLPPGPWELRVYSRWGQLVYATADYQQDWAAAGLASGPYFYCLRLPTQTVVQGWVEVIQ